MNRRVRCAPWLLCDFATLECATGPQDVAQGGECDATSECESGLECIDSACVGDPLPDGAGCLWDVECASARCSDSGVPGSICLAQLTCP